MNVELSMRPDEEPYKSLEVKRLCIKAVSLATEQQLALIITYDQLILLDLEHNIIVRRIRKLSKVRYACLSQSGKLILCHYTDNTLRLMHSDTGNQVGQLIGVPGNPKPFLFSDKSNRVIGGDNQILCLWQIRNCELEIYSRQWRNLNCFAINSDGAYLALGTFNGQIYILRVLSQNKCSQIQYNKHDKCVMIMAWSGNRLLSVSFDHILIVFEFVQNKEKPEEKFLSFRRFQLGFLPREIKVFGQRYFLSGSQGIYWFTANQLIGLTEDIWYVTRLPDGHFELVRYKAGQLDFWKMYPDQKTIVNPTYNH